MRGCVAVVCGVCCLAVLWPNRARAQNVEGQFQLGLATPILSYRSVTTEVGDNPIIEVDARTTTWGIHDEATLELGYGLTNALVLGGILQLGGTSTTTEVEMPNSEESTESRLDVVIGPKLDYMFSEGSRVRPFVSAIVALAHSSSTDDDDDEISLTGVSLQGGAGLRWFATPGFSLDPSLRLGWATASGDSEQDTTSIDVSASGFSVTLGVGFSGWI